MNRLIVAASAAIALTALSGRIEVGAGAALAVLALWWILTGGVHNRLEQRERRSTRRGERN
ncbi:hypothetical protein ACFOY4_04980 [Actinomadura syzygii]|uniref:Uncharacterized protein n=1 Tax=Actinomadura syzygii TaxID=1427538 RepID=A0A5D0TX68_9ACTN|nr:hypothetical protein [Actinomadura syzygii]TYC10040.1 hypothetical protein FXF65_33650 [Actinomadura syzygii]